MKRTRAGSTSGAASAPTRRVVSATVAAKTFGALVNRVREERAEYIVERGGTPVAHIGPVRSVRCTVADLVGLLTSGPRLEKGYLDEVEAGLKFCNRPAVPEDRWGR